LQTQIEETIDEALKASQSENHQKQSSEVFEAHEISTNDHAHEEPQKMPEHLRYEDEKVTSPAKSAAEQAISPSSSTPTYAATEFLSSDTKIVIKKLVELSVGAAFGEIALENANSKRTATIIAETDCKLITITRADYRHVLADVFAKKKATEVAFLKEVPLFSKLNPRTLETLQSVMTHHSHNADQGVDACSALATFCDTVSVILEANSETSDFYIVLSGIVRVVMKLAFEAIGTKSIHESDAAFVHSPKMRCPTELTICRLGTQNTFGDFYHGRKAKSPVAFIADSPKVLDVDFFL
jgi:CRP-like cAMP-binding protein